MAEALKYMYNPRFFDRLCPVLKDTVPRFDENKFIHLVFDRNWPDLELKQRTRQITLALHHFMPADFGKGARVVVSISAALRKSEKEQSYPFIFLPDYIELFGLSHFEESMKAIQEVTKLVSAEFAIRPFILRYPDKTMKQMKVWSLNEDAAVRRLSSEGCRPRLPWAPGLPIFKKDPSPIFSILQNLKADRSEYVRRSVANNLNDITKDHPTVVLKMLRQWDDNNANTKWIIKRACRTLLKKGNEEVHSLHGLSQKIECRVGKLSLPRQINIGEDFSFSFEFTNRSTKEEKFQLNYAIDYVTSLGKISKKVFSIGEYSVGPSQSFFIERKRSFKNLTTRTHHKGKHQLTILVNGKQKASEKFQVQ